MSKILLTGSHGFIGSHVRSALRDHEVDCWDLKIKKNLFDIRPRHLKGVDTIVHLAAKISVQESWENPHAYIEQNILSTFFLAEEAVRAGVKRIVFASSSSVYGNPMSPYASSKFCSEKILLTKQYNNELEVYPLRFFNVYGTGQNREYSGVITLFLEAIKKNKAITIYGDGEQKRDFVYVKDLAEILKFFCETKRELKAPMDIGKGKSNSVNELAQMLFKLTGKKVAINHAPERKEIKNSKADTFIFKSFMPDFKFKTLEEGLEDMLNES